jgi:single-strand DNA-binding protein
MSINSVTLLGRMVKDPDCKQTQSGISVCSFTVAVDRNYKSGEEREADFVNCVCWRGAADFVAKFWKKGDPIALTGRIQTRKWQTDDGQNRYATEVVCDNVSFVPQKKQSDNAQNGAGASFGTTTGSGYGTAQNVSTGGFGAPAVNTNEFAELKEDDGELPF